MEGTWVQSMSAWYQSQVCTESDANEYVEDNSPKLLVECSSDKLWGTGVSMRESEPLNNNKWHNTGWLSDMLMDIRDSNECMEGITSLSSTVCAN